MMNFYEIEQELKDNGLDSNAEYIFLELLKYMNEQNINIGNEHTIKEIVCMLDKLKYFGKVTIKDNNSYNTAKKTMFGQTNGRDYTKWEERALKKIIKEDLYPVNKLSVAYEELSVRSHTKGIFSSRVDEPETVDMDTLY